jgi:hypothetical protein
MLNHYIIIKYQAHTPEQHIDIFCQRMLALKLKIPEIISLDIGRDILCTERSWQLILIMQFESLNTLKIYQQHPEHQSLMEFNALHVADVAAVDFE